MEDNLLIGSLICHAPALREVRAVCRVLNSYRFTLIHQFKSDCISSLLVYLVDSRDLQNIEVLTLNGDPEGHSDQEWTLLLICCVDVLGLNC